MSAQATTGEVAERLIRQFIAVTSPGISQILTLRVFRIQERRVTARLQRAFSDHLALAQRRHLRRTEAQFLSVNPLVVGTQRGAG
jgi:hypothetical protein